MHYNVRVEKRHQEKVSAMFDNDDEFAWFIWKIVIVIAVVLSIAF